jgi:hypothetical protein
MNLNKLILASVAVRGVYRRFAQLSEEEKAQVVEKVKQKLKEKYPEAEAETSDESPDTTEEAAPVEEAAPAPEGEAAPTEGEAEGAPAETTDDDLIDVGDLDWSEEPAGETEEGGEVGEAGEGEAGEGEVGDDETDAFPEYSDNEPAEAETEPDADTEEFEIGESEEALAQEPAAPVQEAAPVQKVELPAEEAVEAPTEEKEEAEPDKDEEKAIPATSGTPMGDIADDMAEDVEEIQQEGKVDPSRILDLFGDMMKMVTLLVKSTPPDEDEEPLDEKKVASRVAEACIADRVVAKLD